MSVAEETRRPPDRGLGTVTGGSGCAAARLSVLPRPSHERLNGHPDSPQRPHASSSPTATGPGGFNIGGGSDRGHFPAQNPGSSGSLGSTHMESWDPMACDAAREGACDGGGGGGGGGDASRPSSSAIDTCDSATPRPSGSLAQWAGVRSMVRVRRRPSGSPKDSMLSLSYTIGQHESNQLGFLAQAEIELGEERSFPPLRLVCTACLRPFGAPSLNLLLNWAHGGAGYTFGAFAILIFLPPGKEHSRAQLQT